MYFTVQIILRIQIGIRVDISSLEKVVLEAPFLNNINHKQTVFGGSLHAVTTLACWSLLHINLVALFEDPIQIVILYNVSTSKWVVFNGC